MPENIQSIAVLAAEDALLINHLHGGFPLDERPFATVGAQLGWSEERVIERLHQLLARGVLTRFGPLFQIERAGGQFVLGPSPCPKSALMWSIPWSIASPRWRTTTAAPTV